MNTDFARRQCRRVENATCSTEARLGMRACSAAAAPVERGGRSSPAARPINGRLPPGRGRRSFTTAALMACGPRALVRWRRPRARENGAASRRREGNKIRAKSAERTSVMMRWQCGGRRAAWARRLAAARCSCGRASR